MWPESVTGAVHSVCTILQPEGLYYRTLKKGSNLVFSLKDKSPARVLEVLQPVCQAGVVLLCTELAAADVLRILNEVLEKEEGATQFVCGSNVFGPIRDNSEKVREVTKRLQEGKFPTTDQAVGAIKQFQESGTLQEAAQGISVEGKQLPNNDWQSVTLKWESKILLVWKNRLNESRPMEESNEATEESDNDGTSEMRESNDNDGSIDIAQSSENDESIDAEESSDTEESNEGGSVDDDSQDNDGSESDEVVEVIVLDDDEDSRDNDSSEDDNLGAKKPDWAGYFDP
ncbi:hypothetical protein HDV00_002800 [Rhizophlyctis rosea]|nr:hypothetical protein HDV00_002800 [Rhizophlyctis rosea]